MGALRRAHRDATARTQVAHAIAKPIRPAQAKNHVTAFRAVGAHLDPGSLVPANPPLERAALRRAHATRTQLPIAIAQPNDRSRLSARNNQFLMCSEKCLST